MGRLSGFRYSEVTRRLRMFGFRFDRPGLLDAYVVFYRVEGGGHAWSGA